MPVGHPVQIVTINSHHRPCLDESALQDVLLADEEISELPIAILSVAGATRSGKSFLLDYLIRFLEAQENNPEYWLGDRNESLEGFEWSAGTERQTTGIWIWSKPYIINMGDDENQMALYLMDTQGTFDLKSTKEEFTSIFALSTLMSSIQVYNLFSDIRSDDLENLKMFTQYGQIAASSGNTDVTPMQNLMFLVRDWKKKMTYNFGGEGGDNYLQTILQINSDDPDEIHQLKSNIQGCFNQVSCFLMPDPGYCIENEEYRGQWSEMRPEFVNNLKSLSSKLLTSELQPKKIGYQIIFPDTAVHMFSAYSEALNNTERPSPELFFQANVGMEAQTVVSLLSSAYRQTMHASINANIIHHISSKDLDELHERAKTNCYVMIQENRYFGGQQTRSKIESDLNEEIQDIFTVIEKDVQYKKREKMQREWKIATEIYNDEMNRKCGDDETFTMNSEDLMSIHNTAINLSLQHVNESVSEEHQEEAKILLKSDINVKFERFKDLNEARKGLILNTALGDSYNHYTINMNQLFQNHENAFSESEVMVTHKLFSEESENMMIKKCKNEDDYPERMQTLKELINSHWQRMCDTNNFRRRSMRTAAIDNICLFYDQQMGINMREGPYMGWSFKRIHQNLCADCIEKIKWCVVEDDIQDTKTTLMKQLEERFTTLSEINGTRQSAKYQSWFQTTTEVLPQVLNLLTFGLDTYSNFSSGSRSLNSSRRGTGRRSSRNYNSSQGRNTNRGGFSGTRTPSSRGSKNFRGTRSTRRP